MICSTVKEDDKVVRGPRVLIQVDQHLQHDHQDDIGDVGGDNDGDGDVGNEYLSPVEDGRVGLRLRDLVLGIKNVNYRHSAFKSTKRKKKNNAKDFLWNLEEYLWSKVNYISFLY